MRVICVDDERLLMQDTVKLCLELDLVDEAKGFTRSEEALNWMEHEPADVALLDIDMPGMNGLGLAAAIREKWPDMPIIFLTGYSQYALDAFSVHASGYLLKPVKKEKLAAELVHASGNTGQKQTGRVTVHTFGNFDVFVDGKPIAFKQVKCKELLAYLIDRQGTRVKRREAFAILWEDRIYDRPMQKQLDVIIRSLRQTLANYGVGEMIELQNATMRINPELISCDAWRYFAGDPDAVNAYRGEYMSNYSWASMTEGLLFSKSEKLLPDILNE